MNVQMQIKHQIRGCRRGLMLSVIVGDNEDIKILIIYVFRSNEPKMHIYALGTINILITFSSCFGRSLTICR